MKVVIVGGVAGGASAAARIRRLDEHAQIVMIERSGYMSYANCGLPYYVGGVIKEQKELTLQTPESFWDRFRIDVRVRQEVTAINPAEKTVTVHALDSGKVYTETYDKLLLAPGAKPTVPAFSGVVAETFTGTPGVYVKLEATVKAFKGILNGDYDHLAEDDFYMVGDIDMALAKYQKRQEN